MSPPNTQPQPASPTAASPRSSHDSQPPVRPSLSSPISIYASPAFKPAEDPAEASPPASPSKASAAAYGLYVDAPADLPANALRTHVSEPLHAADQTRRAASIAALAHALRISRANQSQTVHILIDDKDVADHYNGHAHTWLHNITAAPVDKLWQPVAALVAEHAHKPFVSYVRRDSRNSSTASSLISAPLRKARDLAMQAMGKHAFCRLCHRNYGRFGSKHDCHPICNTPPCHGERFNSVQEYERHMEARHPIAVVFPEDGKLVVSSPKKAHTSANETSADDIEVLKCPACQATFAEFGEFEQHIESECPEALACWFSQTKIVKS